MIGKTKIGMILAPLLMLGVTLVTSPVKAQTTNGSFETGNFAGWSVTPNFLGSVVTNFHPFSTAGNYSAVDGQYFAVIQAGAGANTYTTLSQSFNATSGGILSGSAFFQAGDYLPYNDDGYVRILQGNTVLFQSNVATVGNYGHTPWTNFSYTFAADGNYTIEAGIRNAIDNGFNSYLGVDAVQLTNVTPEVSSLLLLTGGGLPFAAIPMLRRRRSRQG